MMPRARTPAEIKRAEEAIRHFESAGRIVVAVAILKDGFKIEFAPPPDMVSVSADLVIMGKK